MTQRKLEPQQQKAHDWLTANAQQEKKDEERLKTAGKLYPLLEAVASESGDEYWNYGDGSRTHARAVFDILDEAKKDILVNSIQSGVINLGAYFLCDKKIFEKWFGESP